MMIQNLVLLVDEKGENRHLLKDQLSKDLPLRQRKKRKLFQNL